MLQMLQTSGAMGIALVLLAIVGVVLIFERIMVYSRESTDMEGFSEAFGTAVAEKDLEKAKQLCEKESSTPPPEGEKIDLRDLCNGNIAEVFRLALEHVKEGPATLRSILNNHIDLVILPRLRARLRALSAIGKGAPMVGLLGTVWGMMNAFSTIAGTEGGGVNPKDLAGDIGLALGTTFLGLFVAIPVVFMTAWFRAKIERFEIDLDRYSDHVLNLLYRDQPMTTSPVTTKAP